MASQWILSCTEKTLRSRKSAISHSICNHCPGNGAQRPHHECPQQPPRFLDHSPHIGVKQKQRNSQNYKPSSNKCRNRRGRRNRPDIGQQQSGKHRYQRRRQCSSQLGSLGHKPSGRCPTNTTTIVRPPYHPRHRVRRNCIRSFASHHLTRSESSKREDLPHSASESLLSWTFVPLLDDGHTTIRHGDDARTNQETARNQTKIHSVSSRPEQMNYLLSPSARWMCCSR